MHFVGSNSHFEISYTKQTICRFFKQWTFLQRSNLPWSNYNYAVSLRSMTCQHHLEKRAANVKDLVQSSQTPFQ